MDYFPIVQGLGIFVCVLMLGVIAIRDLNARYRAEQRRPRPLFVDVRYSRDRWGGIVREPVLRLSSGLVTLNTDPLYGIGAPGDARPDPRTRHI